MFGRIMRVCTQKGLQLELKPISKADAPEYVKDGGMQLHSVNRWLSPERRCGYTLEDEEEWYERTRKDTSSLVWGIFAIENGDPKLIGGTSLVSIEEGHIRQATSGVMLFRPEYWGKGITTAAHLARTRFAFEELGLHRIRSAVAMPNEASYRALHRIGYEAVYVERNTMFVGGKLHHQRNLECLNPESPFWSQWWGNDRPTARSLAARQRTRDALARARDQVELP